MTNISNSFAKLCRSYVKLADKFQQLDVEHMTLKSKIVPLLKQLKDYQHTIETLKQEKSDLKAEVDTITAKYEELKPFEELLDPEIQALLEEAQEQVDLVDETLGEMEKDDNPDLSEDEKVILRAFHENPEAFSLPDLGSLLGSNSNGHSASMDNYETVSF